MILKELVKKIIYREKYNSARYVKYLRKIGVTIGDNCKIFNPPSNYIDTQNPYMITIGDNVNITQGVVLLTHDYSWCVSCIVDGTINGSVGFITIGNNVFIGFNSIIMKNVEIGDNVIIGAGSVVTKNCEPNSVYAGNPAKKIMSLEDFQKKRESKQTEEIELLIQKYKKKYNNDPSDKVLREYLFFLKKSDEVNSDELQKILIDSNHYELCKNSFLNKKK